MKTSRFVPSEYPVAVQHFTLPSSVVAYLRDGPGRLSACSQRHVPLCGIAVVTTDRSMAWFERELGVAERHGVAVQTWRTLDAGGLVDDADGEDGKVVKTAHHIGENCRERVLWLAFGSIPLAPHASLIVLFLFSTNFDEEFLVSSRSRDRCCINLSFKGCDL